MKNLLAGMREGYAEFDGTMRFILANPAACALLGLPEDAVRDKRIIDLLPFDFARRLESRLGEALEQGTPSQIEEKLGARRLRLRLRPLGERVQLFVEEPPLTPPADLAHRFEMALSINQIVVFEVDRELRYLWVYNNQVGVSDDTILGLRPEDIFDEASARRLSGFFHSVLSSGQARRAELALQGRDASEAREFLCSARPIHDEMGDIVGLAGASIKITSVARHREELAFAWEAAFHARSEARRAFMSKSKFFAAASHDLRQPVQSLLLLIEVLKMLLAGSPVRDTVCQMEKAVEALRFLFDTMLEISRLDAGMVEPAPERISLNGLLAGLAGEYAGRIGTRPLEVRFVPTSLVVRSDPALLERVLRGLLENALRYCPAGRILLGCRRKRNAIHIEVADSGIGISADQIDDIFEDFHQLGNPARDRERGLGLGLSIARRIMHLLGGTITVRSRPGVGSRFSVVLPVATALTGAETALRRLVLIVEKDDLLADSLDMMLCNWGYRTMVAGSAEEALAMAAHRRHPDILVCGTAGGGAAETDRMIEGIGAAVGMPVPAVILQSGCPAADGADPDRIRLPRHTEAERLRAALAKLERRLQQQGGRRLITLL